MMIDKNNSKMYKNCNPIEIIKRFAIACEYMDQDISNHMNRVAQYSYLLAKELGYNEKTSQLIKSIVPLHDIGKISIDDTILKKPGKYTIDEYEEMKKHALMGYNILKDSHNELIDLAAIICLEHHERYDGTGYPLQKKGQEINIFSKICSVSDVFDALTSYRSYKKTWTFEEAYKYVVEQSGKQFDPLVVHAFINIKSKIRDTYHSFN